MGGGGLDVLIIFLFKKIYVFFLELFFLKLRINIRTTNQQSKMFFWGQFVVKVARYIVGNESVT